MREIKFRAWDIKESKWLYGYETLGGFDMKGEFLLMGGYGRGISLEKFLFDIQLMQFTGFKDGNGKEIYEDDFISLGRKFIYIVKFEDGAFILHLAKMHCDQFTRWGYLHRIFDPDFSEYKFEIIGNVHENPELLKS